MKHCKDCVCFDSKKGICRVNGDEVNANTEACVSPHGPPCGWWNEEFAVDYYTYPDVRKCSECQSPCGKGEFCRCLRIAT